MEIYENPACYEGAGAFYEGGGVRIGVKEQDRRKKKREGHSRSLKTSHQHSFKKMFQNDRFTFICVLETN